MVITWPAFKWLLNFRIISGAISVIHSMCLQIFLFSSVLLFMTSFWSFKITILFFRVSHSGVIDLSSWLSFYVSGILKSQNLLIIKECSLTFNSASSRQSSLMFFEILRNARRNIFRGLLEEEKFENSFLCYVPS